MNRAFQVQGWRGWLLFGVAVVGGLALMLLVPTAFWMVFWNAIVFEKMGGPEIGILPAFLLTLISGLAFYLVVRPTIDVRFQQDAEDSDSSGLSQSGGD